MLDLSLRLAFALSVLGRFREILDLLLPQMARLQAIGAPPAVSGPYHCRLALTHSYLGEQPDATRHAEQAFAAARQCDDAVTAGTAHYTLALSSHALGDLRAGVEHSEAAIAALERAGERYWLGLAHWVLGMNQAILGELDAALRAEALADQIGASIGDARIRSLAVSTRGWIHALRGDHDDALAECTEGVALAHDPISAAAALRRLGMARLAAGDPGAAASTLEEWLRRLGDLGVRLGLSQGLASLSEAQLSCGSPARARGLAQESLRTAGADALGEGCARRALGLVARAGNRLGDAEKELAEACRIFERIGARLDCVRANVDLAEVAAAQGRHEVRLQHLARARDLSDALGIPRQTAAVEGRVAGHVGRRP